MVNTLLLSKIPMFKQQFTVYLITALALSMILLPFYASAQPRTEIFTPFTDTTSLLSLPASPDTKEGEVVEISGILTVFWIDQSGLEFSQDNNLVYYLMDNSGKYYQLLFSDETKKQTSGFVDLESQNVIVTGTLNELDNSINVQKIGPDDKSESSSEAIKSDKDFTTETHVPSPGPGFFGEHVLGTQKFATILCRFGDSTDFTPESPSYAKNLMDRVNKYYEDVSYDKINLDGSTVHGWYDLPEPRNNYLLETPAPPGGDIDIPKLLVDCTNAANDDIFFPDYDGINLLFNQGLLGVGGIGFSAVPLIADGEAKFYRGTFMTLSGWHNQGVLAHELGHSFRLPHSSGPYNTPYDSNWDVMSNTEGCIQPSPDFRCDGPHTNSFYKYAIGWIDPSRTYIATTAPNQNIVIERLANPHPRSPGYLTAIVPIGGSDTEFYSIEARKRVGYDRNEIPNPGILIHKIDLSISDINERAAQVADSTKDFNPNDAGAVWTPGETFSDTTNNIAVKVLKETDTGFSIVINPSP